MHLAARRAIRALLDGRQVVMVVSAMGDTTDRLIRETRIISAGPRVYDIGYTYDPSATGCAGAVGPR